MPLDQLDTTRAYVEWDRERNEPFVALPGHPDFRLTPMGKEDEDGFVRLSNEPSSARWSLRRPSPFTRADAAQWIDPAVTQNEAYLPLVERAVKSKTPGPGPTPPGEFALALRYIPVGPSPPTVMLRSEQDIRKGDLLGSMRLKPAVVDMGISTADLLALPRSEQAWEIGYDLLERMRGQGLGKSMVLAALHGWLNWLGVGRILAYAETANAASSAVLVKCGFEEEKRFWKEWPEAKGGGEREVIRWVWAGDRSGPRRPADQEKPSPAGT